MTMIDQPASTAPDTSADERQIDDHRQDESQREDRPKDVVQKVDRPFRVKLRGSVLVFVRLPNRRSVRAAFHQLSTTGGVIHLEKPLEEKLDVEMIFHLGQTTIRSKAQMLFPMWATQGWMQPFRFVDLNDASREALDANLKSFVGGPARTVAAGA
jgi:hypothetical protein